jgi:hypothetical protein
LYVIESSDDIELLDVQELVAKPEKITIIANEYNPLDWHGWLAGDRALQERYRDLVLENK